MSQHIIKRLTFSLRFPEREHAVQLEHDVVNIYHDRIEQLLDEYFSRFAGSDTEYRIDKLELDLGSIKPENLRAEMPERVMQQLGKIEDDSQDCGTYIISEQERQLSLFHHFIGTGTLPWWAGKLDKQALEQLAAQLCVNYPAELRGLISDILRDRDIIRRLVNQFSDNCLSRISRLYLSEQEVNLIVLRLRDLEALFAEVDKQSGARRIRSSSQFPADEAYPGGMSHKYADTSLVSPGEQDGNCRGHTSRRMQAIDARPGGIRVRKQYWLNILSGLANGPTDKYSSAQLLRNVFVSLADNNHDAYLHLLARSAEAVESLARGFYRFNTPLPDLINKFIADVTPGKEGFAAVSTGDQASADYTSAAQTERTVSVPARMSVDSGSALTGVAQKKTSSSRQAAEAGRSSVRAPFTDAEEDYIHNAGLVILWPYLPRFFINLGLVDENNFIDDSAAERAVMLLQYLVEPDTEMPESLLSLNKLLCGLEQNRPVPADFTPTEGEEGECDALINAVRHHWNILASMSVERIRSDFLQRQGILRPCAGNWQLQVENRVHDILMQKLPWPIGVVKLPWMDYALLVHWG